MYRSQNQQRNLGGGLQSAALIISFESNCFDAALSSSSCSQVLDALCSAQVNSVDGQSHLRDKVWMTASGQARERDITLGTLHQGLQVSTKSATEETDDE
jgi:hypothetical protein